MNNVHNLDAITLGTGEFSFSPDATSAIDAIAKGYVDFGNITALSPAPEVTKLEHKGSYRGIRRTDRTAITDTKLKYTVKVDEISATTLKLALLGSDGTGFTQNAITTTAGTNISFAANNPSQSDRWYDVLDATGKHVREISALTITGKVEGTDFEVDQKVGRIRFLTTQTANVTPNISAPAITNVSNSYLKAITPMNSAVRKGFGHILLFDDANPNKLIYDHKDFSCEVSFTSMNDFDGQNYSEITLEVLVTGTVGTVYTAE